MKYAISDSEYDVSATVCLLQMSTVDEDAASAAAATNDRYSVLWMLELFISTSHHERMRLQSSR